MLGEEWLRGLLAAAYIERERICTSVLMIDFLFLQNISAGN